MPRLPRCDRPGRWFHVFNRGLAHRPVFESLADIRFFLACVACAVRRGEIEIHAYCVMTTHFHLLVRSPTGDLAVAMDRILNIYVRYYNRTRGRDGSLFRGRYGARPVDSLVYRRVLVRYIDRNPVQARLVQRPWDYPHASARYYVGGRRPPWLSTGWIDACLERAGGAGQGADYATVFGRKWSRPEQALVRGRVDAPTNRDDPLDDLIDAAPPAVLAWMRRKAQLADGAPPSLPATDARTILAAVKRTRTRSAAWTYAAGSRIAQDAWPVAEAYLLRHLAALSLADIGRRQGVCHAAAGRRVVRAQELIGGDPEFARRIAAIAHDVLRRSLRD